MKTKVDPKIENEVSSEKEKDSHKERKLALKELRRSSLI